MFRAWEAEQPDGCLDRRGKRSTFGIHTEIDGFDIWMFSSLPLHAWEVVRSCDFSI